jgi:hypothetical protein
MTSGVPFGAGVADRHAIEVSLRQGPGARRKASTVPFIAPPFTSVTEASCE